HTQRRMLEWLGALYGYYGRLSQHQCIQWTGCRQTCVSGASGAGLAGQPPACVCEGHGHRLVRARPSKPELNPRAQAGSTAFTVAENLATISSISDSVQMNGGASRT